MFDLKIGDLLGARRGAVLLAASWILVPSVSAGQVLSGDISGDAFGFAVAWAGDVNGDGYDDFLVGAPQALVGAGRVGKVRLYLGKGIDFPHGPSKVFEGEIGGDEFGYAVSTAGDVNGDGYDDFLVGAPGADTDSPGGENAGKVYLFLGGSSISATPARVFPGNHPQARFGHALAGGFDFDDDGLDDFAGGAPNHSGQLQNGGQVRIFFGRESVGDVASTITLYGDQGNWLLGSSLDPAGDVNHDGYDDLIAGAPQTLDLNSGRAVIWFGQASDTGTPGRLVLSGELGGDAFGFDVSGAGDLNGDGFDDVVVGAPDHDAAGADKGAIYVFQGGSSMNAASDGKATGAVGGDHLGTAVDGGFDLDGDGTSDLAAGAPGSDMIAANAGEVRIYLGGGALSQEPDRILFPDSPAPTFEAGDGFGTSVRFAGSYNGDEYAEILAGAPDGNSGSGSEAGYVDLIPEPGTLVPVRVLSFGAEAVAGGVEIRWELAETGGLAGLRLELEREGTIRPLHEGWLPPAARSFLDRTSPEGGSYVLRARNRDGSTERLAETGVPGTRTLLRVGPPDRNPFRDEVAFAVTAPPGAVEISVWDARGRRVRLLDGAVSGGAVFRAVWDGRDDRGRDAPAGCYVVQVLAGGARASVKVIRLP